MLLDTAVIDDVRETLGDDVYRGFAARMLSEVAETTGTLRDLLAKGDLETLAKAAHTTSGSAAGIGAKGLHALLTDTENACRCTAAPRSCPALVPPFPQPATTTPRRPDPTPSRAARPPSGGSPPPPRST